MKLTITYNGMEYPDFKQAIDKQIENKMVEVAKKRLSPFEKEIKEAGGEVTFDFSEGYKLQMKITGIPDDLSERINNHFK